MATDLRIGSNIGGYAVESLLGRGGMSVVYLAKDANLGRKVALKVMSEELSGNESFRIRFVREAQMAANLEHPSIVPVYDAGDADGVLFLAMRVIRGTDLRRAITENGPMEAERALAILRQVASALDAAHRAGLVHRDVKPANVLLSREGDDEHAYLTDFGLTKHVASRSGLTRTGQFMGTIDYVAPEQIRGNDVDGRTDLYSLGCVTYECLTGEVPFAKDQDVAILFAHLEDERPRVTAHRADLAGSIDDVVARAMARLPEDRYDSCLAFVAAAREALGVAVSPSSAATVVPPPTVFAAPPLPVQPVLEPHPSFPPADPPVPPEFTSVPPLGAEPALVALGEPPSVATASVEAPSAPAWVPPPPAAPEVARPRGSPDRQEKSGSRRGLMIMVIIAVLAILGTVGAIALSGGEEAPSSELSGGGEAPSSELPVTPPQAISPTETPSPTVSPTPTESPTPVDEAPPPVRSPLNPRTTSVTTSSVALAWGAAPHGGEAVRFLILRDGEQIGKTTQTAFVDEDVTASTRFVYRIVGVGADGSRASSEAVSVTTPAPPSTGGGGGGGGGGETCTGIVLPNGDCIPA